MKNTLNYYEYMFIRLHMSLDEKKSSLHLLIILHIVFNWMKT